MNVIRNVINAVWAKPIKAEFHESGHLQIGGRLYEVKLGKKDLTEIQKTKVLEALNSPNFNLKKEITQKVSKGAERLTLNLKEVLEETPIERTSPEGSPNLSTSMMEPLIAETEDALVLDETGDDLTNVDLIAISKSPETYSHKQVKERIELVRDNALKFLYQSATSYTDQTKNNPETLAKLGEILEEQHLAIVKECDDLISNLPEDKNITAGELKQLLKEKKKFFGLFGKNGLEKKIENQLHRAQVKMSKELASDAPMGAFLKKVEEARRKNDLLPVDEARLNAPTNHRVARMNNGDTYIAPTTNKSVLKKQFKLFAAQEMSAMTKREKTTNEVSLKETKYSSELVPLNGHFSPHFGKIVGHDGGISSAEVHNPHLKNGIESTLKNDDGTLISRTIRHGILGREGEKTQAKELVEAAVLQELSDLGDKRQEGEPLKITLTSVSLVSPGSNTIESLVKEEGKNEFELWNQQLEALRAAQDLKEVTINGEKIKVEISVVPFNFGVNKMAANVVGYGNAEQFKQNKESRDALLSLIEKHVNELPKEHQDPEFLDEIKTLGEDIDALLLDPTAYTKGKDQYECAAKIICLMNACDRFRQKLIDKGVSHDKLPPSFKNAINCMSGKDRTGVLDASVKAHEILRQNHGRYLSHQEMDNTRSLRLEYTETLLILLAEGGGLEVTKWNTGVKGYKIDDRFLPWHDDKKLNKEAMENLRKKGYYDIEKALRGLGKTTGS